jgi:hypothetical protein
MMGTSEEHMNKIMTVSISDIFSGSKPEDSTCHSSLTKTASEDFRCCSSPKKTACKNEVLQQSKQHCN